MHGSNEVGRCVGGRVGDKSIITVSTFLLSSDSSQDLDAHGCCSHRGRMGCRDAPPASCFRTGRGDPEEPGAVSLRRQEVCSPIDLNGTRGSQIMT